MCSEKEVQAQVDMVRSVMQVSNPLWDQIAKCTNEDSVLKDVMYAVQMGWETAKTRGLKPYYHERRDITIIDGVLVKGKKVIVPAAMRSEMLSKVHKGHLGIEKCQARPRQVM